MVLSKSLLAAAASTLFLAFQAEAVSSDLQNVLMHKNPAYTYPTDLTRDIVPIHVHSHNDYWRDVPFFTALSHGVISVEADVWLKNGVLYVGHEESALTPERTFESLYINPIRGVLDRQNPKSRFLSSPTNNGVFDTSSGQTLYLFVDLKSSGPETFKAVIAALKPLREKGYLTTLTHNKTITAGPVTVIGTGNTPLDMVAPVANRDYFFDGPLDKLGEPENEGITALISPIASTSFGAAIGPLTLSENNSTVLSDEQFHILRSQLAVAKERGILARYWDTPAYPIRARNLLWMTLITEGVGLLNADDLASAAGFF